AEEDRIRERNGPRVRLLHGECGDEPREPRQPSRQGVATKTPSLDVRLRLPQLDATERRVQVRGLVVATEIGVDEVLARSLTEVADSPHLVGQLVVVRHDHAALGGRYDLVRIQAEDPAPREGAPRPTAGTGPGRPPATLNPRHSLPRRQ